MRIGHFYNMLVQLSEKLAATVRSMTVGGFISFIRETVVGPWLNPDRVTARLRGCLQLRLEQRLKLLAVHRLPHRADAWDRCGRNLQDLVRDPPSGA